MSDVTFEVEELLAESREATGGLSDFGPGDFRGGLEALAETYTRQFTAKGQKRNRRRLVQLLATRLRVQAALEREPEIRERELPAPMVLTGLPRSGTSALFNTLASDPDARPLLLWETQFPDPAEGLAPGEPDPRRAAIEAYYAKSREKHPEFTKIHYASADTPEECVLLHAYAMHGVQMGTEIMLEPYASWYRSQPLDEMYAYYKQQLQLLDWQRPGKRWLLKAPAHMWGIDALVRTFPDVSIVWSHRDPLSCTASICSMTQALMQDQVEIAPQVLGPIVMDFYATSLERGLEARDRLEPSRFLDVNHDSFVAGGLAVAERIYEHFGLPLEPATRALLETHVAEHPRGKHGSHEYSLEAFGITPEDAKKRFASYIDRFEIELT
jgi:hypothetical protein